MDKFINTPGHVSQHAADQALPKGALNGAIGKRGFHSDCRRRTFSDLQKQAIEPRQSIVSHVEIDVPKSRPRQIARLFDQSYHLCAKLLEPDVLCDEAANKIMIMKLAALV